MTTRATRQRCSDRFCAGAASVACDWIVERLHHDAVFRCNAALCVRHARATHKPDSHLCPAHASAWDRQKSREVRA